MADDPSPTERLKEMVKFGTRLFAIPKEKVAAEEAKRPKRPRRRRPKSGEAGGSNQES